MKVGPHLLHQGGNLNYTKFPTHKNPQAHLVMPFILVQVTCSHLSTSHTCAVPVWMPMARSSWRSPSTLMTWEQFCVDMCWKSVKCSDSLSYKQQVWVGQVPIALVWGQPSHLAGLEQV